MSLSALLVSSAIAFTAVQYLGAAYLIYLGIRTLLARDELDPGGQPRTQRLSSIYGQSVVVTTFNPKLALFMLSLLPQFVDPSRGLGSTADRCAGRHPGSGHRSERQLLRPTGRDRGGAVASRRAG